MKNPTVEAERLDTYRRAASQYVNALEPEDLETLVESGRHTGDMPEAHRYVLWYVNARDRAAGRKPPMKPRAPRKVATT